MRTYSEDAREGACLVAECPGMSSFNVSRLQLGCVFWKKIGKRDRGGAMTCSMVIC